MPVDWMTGLRGGMMIGGATVGRRRVVGGAFPAPPERRLDLRLIGGFVLLGLGWGLVGLCPGPAMASLFWGGAGGIVFMVAMIVGMILTPPFARHLDATRTAV